MYWPRYGMTNWDPFAELRTLQREMNRLFNGYSTEQAAYPALNVWSNGTEAVVTAEVPGVDPSEIDINVERDELTIAGERKAGEPAEGVVCHRSERGAGRFVRTVRLPFEVQHDAVKATHRHGVLTVKLPRSEATKPKRIEIAGA